MKDHTFINGISMVMCANCKKCKDAMVPCWDQYGLDLNEPWNLAILGCQVTQATTIKSEERARSL